ncbi:MAG TPA: Ig-like domain-containing protein [Gemmatimonadales bacterium]|nr:Ig-like domain-containing protein [Gemmatimonadales bacterium]
MRCPHKLRATLLFIIAGTSSCAHDSSGPPPPPPPPPATRLGLAHGSWNADGPDFIAYLGIADTVLVATGIGRIAGSGSFAGAGINGGLLSFTVSGTDSSGSITLTLTAPGLTAAHFIGQAADTEMDGSINGSGFTNVQLQFKHHAIVVSLIVAPPGDSTVPGHAVQLMDTAFDLLHRALPPQPVAWSVSDSTRASISAGGLLTGLAHGSVIVTASIGGVQGQAPFQVLEPVANVIIAPPALAAVAGVTLPLGAAPVDSAGTLIPGRTLTWSSSNTTVATVDQTGFVTIHTIGSANIRATAQLDGKADTAPLVVRTVSLTQVAAGGLHSCALDADSTVACWGDGTRGQLGSAVRSTIAAPLFVTGGTRFRLVQTGDAHTCGIAVDSSAYCWGLGGSGQLGSGTAISDTVPAAVTGGLKFVALALGEQHTCGLVAGGTAYCWGSNFYGELGVGASSPDPNPDPLPVSGGLSFAALTAGSGYSCGLTSVGAAYCWGDNTVGQLGDSTTAGHDTPMPVAGGLTFAAIAAGRNHACALTSAGVAYCWGYNGSGEVGDSSGLQVREVPVAVHAAGVLFTGITTGGNHTCAVATTAAIYCWGSNGNGQAGPNANSTAYVPVSVGLSGSSVVAGGFHSCAVTAAGVYCWGFNQYGELGGGTTQLQSATPLKVAGQQ